MDLKNLYFPSFYFGFAKLVNILSLSYTDFTGYNGLAAVVVKIMTQKT